ncbi:MAG TPA: Xaa-Pro aminopeptidase [Myxococcaceae bacterium]|nr:Xaa-Pro aminopeptidase [Myxococcaceae bacterium]
MRPVVCASLLLLVCACAHTVAPPQPDRSALPSWSEQIRVREEWLTRRHALLLEMMRRHGVGMWIVVNEEFHDDPLTQFVAPPRPYAGNRDLFVFVDAGPAGLARHAVTGFWEEALSRYFETDRDPKPWDQAMKALYEKYRPRTIALSIDGKRGVTRSLTKTTHDALAEAMGPEAKARFVPAGPLIEEYSDTRLPEEAPVYRRMVELTEALARRALSAEVIRPGTTRVGDVRRWLFDRAWGLGVSLWFQPDLRVQRKGKAPDMSRGFLAVADEAVIIERGDVLHLDFGFTFMGLNTDFQRMAYVLRDGEAAAPAGLEAALANTRALQDVLMREEARPGRPSAEVHEGTMAKMKARGITAQIYSHPLGFQGHALGPSIDMRSAARKEPSRPLRPGSYLAVELNTRTAVPEWAGQEVFMMEEDPAWLDGDGYHFFAEQQMQLFLVR